MVDGDYLVDGIALRFTDVHADKCSVSQSVSATTTRTHRMLSSSYDTNVVQDASLWLSIVNRYIRLYYIDTHDVQFPYCVCKLSM